MKNLIIIFLSIFMSAQCFAQTGDKLFADEDFVRLVEITQEAGNDLENEEVFTFLKVNKEAQKLKVKLIRKYPFLKDGLDEGFYQSIQGAVVSISSDSDFDCFTYAVVIGAVIGFTTGIPSIGSEITEHIISICERAYISYPKN